MPKITIYESDNTGSTYNGDEINVFVPGNCTLAGAKPELNLEVKITEEKSKKYVTFLDATIDPAVTYYITGVTDKAINVTTTKTDFTAPSNLTVNVNTTYSNAASKYDLVYDFASNVFVVKKYVALHNFDEHGCMLISANSNISEYLSEGSDKSYKYVEDLLKAGLGVVYFSGTPSGTDKNLEFLKDYNAYNVEVLTMGAPSNIPDSFSKDLADYLIDICGSRKDCFALIDYPTKANNDTMISVK
nr:MAG TPA: tail sheath protein [Caudoviricetes sp.]